MDTICTSTWGSGRRRVARALRRGTCALGLALSMAPVAALASSVAAIEEEAPAPLPFQLPAASAGAPLNAATDSSLSAYLLLLSCMLVAGTLLALFRSCSQRNQHAHAAPSQRLAIRLRH